MNDQTKSFVALLANALNQKCGSATSFYPTITPIARTDDQGVTIAAYKSSMEWYPHSHLNRVFQPLFIPSTQEKHLNQRADKKCIEKSIEVLPHPHLSNHCAFISSRQAFNTSSGSTISMQIGCPHFSRVQGRQGALPWTILYLSGDV